VDVQTFNIEGLFLLKPRVFGDDRGYFLESYNKNKLKGVIGLDLDFVQDNESKSSYGVLRGLHFQNPPFAQTKLVRVIEGKVLDVAVDLRKKSPTFGQHQVVELSAKNKHQFLVPRGFAHGFVVLSDTAIFAYKVDNWYAPDHDNGIMFNDETLNIDWQIPAEDIKLSQKDNQLQTFESYCENQVF
jgi:dTDP-4-dehydrorhamnose 3,5-epimerase